MAGYMGLEVRGNSWAKDLSVQICHLFLAAQGHRGKGVNGRRHRRKEEPLQAEEFQVY